MHIQPKLPFEFKEQHAQPYGLQSRKQPDFKEDYSLSQLRIEGVSLGKRQSALFATENVQPVEDDIQMNHNSDNYQIGESNSLGGYLPRKIKKISSLQFAIGHPLTCPGSTRVSETAGNPFEISKDAINQQFPFLLENRSTDYSSDVLSGNQNMGSHLMNLNLARHHSNNEMNSNNEALFANNAYFDQNVFTQCNSPNLGRKRNSNISRRLFEDVAMPSVQDEQSNYNQASDANSYPEESSSQGDVDEFGQDEQHPLEQLLRLRGRNEFVYDPENGGGRRRRNKKVSRIELLNLQGNSNGALKNQIRSKPIKPCMPSNEETQVLTDSERPMGVNPSFYNEDSSARMLQMIEEPRNIGKNSITAHTLANFMDSSKLQEKQYLIVDCRFDYEFLGGHIENAINLNEPKAMQDFFFKDQSSVERLMQTVIIFHCEFSQKRGPEMYQALREIDRRLHVSCYPQLFYSEIYILEGGYKNFHETLPELCVGGYVPMLDKNFKEDCKDKFNSHQRMYKEFNIQKRNILDKENICPFGSENIQDCSEGNSF